MTLWPFPESLRKIAEEELAGDDCLPPGSFYKHLYSRFYPDMNGNKDLDSPLNGPALRDQGCGDFLESCPDAASPLPQNIRQFDTGAVRSTDSDDVRFDLVSPQALRRLAAR